MTKRDLIDALAANENISEKQSQEIIETLFTAFEGTLKKGERIEIRGFGSFCVRQYDSYTGRNPKSGERVAVNPKRLPFFKVGRELKKRVHGGPLTD